MKRRIEESLTEILKLGKQLKDKKKISSKKKTIMAKRKRRASASFSDSVADTATTLTNCVSLLILIIYLIFTSTIVNKHTITYKIQTKLYV